MHTLVLSLDLCLLHGMIWLKQNQFDSFGSQNPTERATDNSSGQNESELRINQVLLLSDNIWHDLMRVFAWLSPSQQIWLLSFSI